MQFDLQIVAIWAVAGVSLLVQIYLFVTWPKEQTAEANNSGTAFPPMDGATAQAAAWQANPTESLDGILGDFSASMTNSRSRRRRTAREPVTMQQRIVRAGIYHKSGMRNFYIVRYSVTLGLLFSGFLVIPFTTLPFEFAMMIGGVAGLAGYLAPSFWLDVRLRSRQTKMRRALPDALDLITVCLQGGLSLPASLARVARELGPAHPMLAAELSIVEREIQMGRNTGSAMLQFAQRFDLEELRSLSSVIGQTEKYGGTIAGALKTYAESLRIRRRQHAEEMAQKAAVKLLFPTLFCIFPGIFVVILGPTAVRMYQVMSQISWSG